jgi:hypothetical protein
MVVKIMDLLYNDIQDGKIPLVAKDENKQFTLPRTADIK